MCSEIDEKDEYEAMIMKVKIYFPDILYYIAVFLTAISSTIIGSTYLFLIPHFNPIVKYGALVCFFLYFLMIRWKKPDFIGAVVFIIITFLCALLIDNTMIILYFLMIVLSGSQDFNKVCKSLFIINISLVFLVVMLYLVGILDDNVVIEGDRIAHSMGFAYYSTLAYYYFSLFISGYYLISGKRKEAKKLLWLLTGCLLNVVIFKITTVRLAFICVCLFVVLAIFIDLLNILKYFKVNLFIATVMYPFMFFLSILLPFIYTKNNILIKFDALLNGRLKFSHMAFERYNVTLLGQLIVTDPGGLDENGLNTYFYIDSGYISLLLQNGLILCLIVLIMYTLISRYAVKTNNKALFIWCIMICVFSFVNNIIINAVMNPLLIMFPIILMKYKKYLIGELKNKIR